MQIVHLIAVLTVALASVSARSLDRGAEPDTAGITVRVQAAMGITGRSADVEAPLAGAMAAVRQDASKLPEAARALVDAVNLGFDPAPMAAKLRSINTVDDERGARSEPPGWTLGTYWHRQKLCEYLYAKANDMQKTDVDAGARFVRAAWVLTALEVETNGDVTGLLPDHLHVPERARLTEAQAGDLRKVCAEYQAKLDAERALLLKFRREMFAAVKQNETGPLPKDKVDTALKLAGEAWQKTETVPSKLAIVCYLTWFTSKAQARKDEGSAGQVISVLKSWRDSSKGQPIEYWIKQSLAKNGLA